MNEKNDNNFDNKENEKNDSTYDFKLSNECDESLNKVDETENKTNEKSNNQPEEDSNNIENDSFLISNETEMNSNFDYDEDNSQKIVKIKKVKKKHRKSKILFFLCAILIVSILLATTIMIGVNDLLGLFKGDNEIAVEIPKGSNSSEIVDVLSQKNIIGFPLLFKLYLNINDEGSDFQYGEHILSPSMGYAEIIQELKKNAVKKDAIAITIPEGYNLYSIAQLLLDNKIIEQKDDFIEYFNRNDQGFEFEKDIPINNLRFCRKEGYAFPDTYEFYEGEQLKSISQKLLKNFDEKTKSINAEINAGMEKYNLTFDQVIVLASIIQAESSDEIHMQDVAGVFHNRLKNSVLYPKLQSDPTTLYGKNVIKKHSTVVDEKMLNAYDTYVCNSLPVGAICSPGIEAIKAAVNPKESEYYYFVTDKQGNFYFAKTYNEHKINCNKAGINTPY